MAFRSSTSSGGSTTTVTVAVPSGAATNDIAILAISADSGSLDTYTWPTGFTSLGGVAIASPDGQTFAFAWKRLTGADSGNYVTTLSATGGDHLAECALFSGRHTTNPPVASTIATDTNANSSPISVSATGVTAVAGDDLLWIGAADATAGGGGTSWSPPSTFTERQDDVNAGPGGGWANGSLATSDNVSAGATGTITGTFTATVTAGWFATLIRIPAAPSVNISNNENFSGKFLPAKFNLLASLRSNIAADFSIAQVQPETNTNFIGKFRSDQIRSFPGLWRNSATDSPVVVVPETNTHFIGRFFPTRFALLPQLSRAEPQDTSTAQTQPETNVHFAGRFTPAKFMLLPQLRHNIAADFSSSVQPETSVHFAGKFAPTRFNRLLGLSFNIAADDSTAQVQPENNNHFIGKFRPDQIRLLPGLRQNNVIDTPIVPETSTNTHFVGKFQPTILNRLLALNFHGSADSSPQTQAETNVHHVGKFRPTALTLMPSLWRNGAIVEPLGVQAETNPHFIGKFRPSKFTLQPSLAWNPAHSSAALGAQPSTPVHFKGRFRPNKFTLQKWLREVPATDFVVGPILHFCPDVIGGMAAYSITGDMAVYAVTGAAVGTSCGGVISGNGIDSSTVLMLHCDGVNASTTFTDSSFSPHTVTAGGNAQIDTAQSRFGGSAALFDGTGDSVFADGGTSLTFGSGDFTVDLWVRFASVAGTVVIFDFRSAVDNVNPAHLSLVGAKLFFIGGNVSIVSGTTTIVTNTWYHVAVARTGGTSTLYLNGVSEGSGADANNYTTGVNRPMIGLSGSSGVSGLNGWIDEFRVSKGIARWSANFTPPTEAYSPIVSFSNCPVIGSMAAYSVTGSGTLPRVC